jgi:zinc transporter 5/7
MFFFLGHSHGGGSCSSDKAGPSNHNILGIYLHILADTLGSAGVIISSLMVQYWGWTSADAICSIIISVLIVLSVLPLIKSAAHILLHRIPEHLEIVIKNAIKRAIEVDGVLNFHSPKFWSLSDTDIIGSISIQIAEHIDEQYILNILTDIFKDGTGITNMTIQIEKNSFIYEQSNRGIILY